MWILLFAGRVMVFVYLHKDPTKSINDMHPFDKLKMIIRVSLL